ncbi:MAG: phosphoenolpyruvate-protein phosphotransferase [Pirellulaceae bacterium]|nr:MAG: phosphoenolpyruvate-protein phosphotransferase [Pirellulaceae bacterium]
MMRKGLAVSPGVAIGTAYCIQEVFVAADRHVVPKDDVAAELARYRAACEATARDLESLQEKVTAQVGRQTGAIFAVHRAILRDPAFTQRVPHWITTEQLSAAAALKRLLGEYQALFEQAQDEHLRERINDVRDVVIRLSAYVSEALRPESHALPGPLIVIADELLPSQAVTLGQIEVAGIVTERGSQTSHAAIIARSRGIPAVSGVAHILHQVTTGDLVIVDGRHGHVFIHPDEGTLAAYRKLEREYQLLRRQWVAARELPSTTADGTPLELLANVNNAQEANLAQDQGAGGVGLYRTEYLYLTHPALPDEEEQYREYCRVIEASPRHLVTLRTLDIGGDKTVPYLGHQHPEANPFLGWRSIRLSFEHPELFATQLRAVLRAAHHARQLGGELRVLFPMITTVEELRKVRRMLYRAGQQLAERGVEYLPVSCGMMLEVPAAAATLDLLLPLVDFVCVGSNDLVQYLMAADRDNPKVSHLYQPLAPAVLRVLQQSIQICRQAKKPITVCGEMAGQPRAFLVLLGLGLRSFSMSPAFLPSIKQLAQHVTVNQCRAWADHALTLRSARGVRRFLTQCLEELAPELNLLETD